jgi:acetoacetyl-CoA synthetase
MEKLWDPKEEFIRTTNIFKFTEWLENETGLSFPDYNSLHAWSIAEFQSFWELFLKYSKIKYSSTYHNVINQLNLASVKWFEGIELNYTENIFTYNHKGTALNLLIEDSLNFSINYSYKNSYTFNELKDAVGNCANSLRELGVIKGDRIAGYIANVPEAVICALASASIGAVWSSASPDFGADAVCERFEQVMPKIVFASTHYIYNGKTFHNSDKIEVLRERVKSIEKLTAKNEAQVLTYLKVSKKRIGYLINFGNISLEFKRLIILSIR